ncbi:MAG: TonB-dependent receptor [Acidobacteriota bacterium]|nr:TonB-dependent receptor [Acidobacteriota bacterium]
MRNLLKKTLSVAGAALMLAFLLSGAVLAQETTGSIVGMVQDINGAAVVGATVTISDSTKGNIVVRTATTGEDGTYSAPSLPISTYTVIVEAANFKRSQQTDVRIEVGQRRPLDFTLEAGSVAEVVTVEADPVAVELTTPTAATTVTGDQVRELSINNRNFVQLVTLAPGVSSNLDDQVYVGTTNPAGGANTVSISVNGARSSQNTFTVDGADITDRGSNLTIQAYPSVDAIGEFKVLRALYPAESGRSGGGQVNVVTRSGTDRFSGSVFEFVRNEAFNANSFFNNRNRPFGLDENGKAKRAPFRYHNFGWTLGGPIYFLNFGEGDPDEGIFRRYKNTFFFFSQEWRRDLRYPTLISTVPDANLRQGIFPIDVCLSGTISGTTRTCTNVLPAGTPLSSRAAINPVAQQYLNFIYNNMPLPNGANFALTSAAVNRSRFRQEIFKIDHRFTEKMSAFYRYQRDAIPTIDVNALFSSGSGIPGVSTTSTDSPGRAHTAQVTYALSPKVIAQGRYSYSYGAILSETIGLLSRERSPVNIPLPYTATGDRVTNITGAGFSNLQGFGPYDNFSDKHNYEGSLTWIIGNHTTKFGGMFSKYRKNENSGAGNSGAFSGFLNTTSASATQGSVLATNVANTTLNNNIQNFANFLLGTNVTFTQTRYDITGDLRQRTFEAYGQDEWRVRDNLTVYLGVRYSFFGAPWDRKGFLTNFIPELYNRSSSPLVTGGGNRVVGTGNFCEGLVYNSQNPPPTLLLGCAPSPSPYGKYVVDAPKNDFAPRIGLAWDPFGDGKTSIRTGYGMYHEQVLSGVFLQNIFTNPPYQETITVSQTRLDQPIAPGQTPSLVASAAAQTLRAVQADWKTPYMQHWSLDVQRQLASKTIVSAGYYGSKGTNLIGIVDINLLPPGFALTQQCATGTSTTPTVACQQQGVPFTSGAGELILDQIRPFRGYRAINMIQPRFDSNYHSLQVSATQRFTGTSQVQLAYTWAKNLTNNQTDRSTAPQNPYNIDAEYGRAQLDRRHVLTVNYIYELPFYREQRGFAGKVLGGWQVSGIVTYQTGIPFTPTLGGGLYDPAGIGFLGPSASGSRPIQYADPFTAGPIAANPDPRCQTTQSQGGLAADQVRTFSSWFNPCAFQTVFPTSGVANVPGSAGRGVINGPDTFRADLTLSKNIRFTETMRLQLRGEVFNIFNKTNFTGFGTVATTPTSFGVITGTRDPRTFQFGIKFYF